MKKTVVFIFYFLFFIKAGAVTTFSEKPAIDTIDYSFNNEKLNISNDTAGIQQLLNVYLKERKSNPYLALSYLNQAQEIATSIKDEKQTALILYHKGYLYRILGIYNFAIKSYLLALNHFEKLNDKKMIAWVYLDIGNLYFLQKEKWAAAIEHFEKAAKLFKELPEMQGVVVATNNIGLTYKDKKEYDKALSYFFKDVELAKSINDVEDHILALSFIGQVYLLKMQYDSAQIYFNKTFELSSSKNLKQWIAYSYDNYAGSDLMKKRTGSAIQNYEKALGIYREMDDKLNIATILQKISTAYAQDKNYTKAIGYALQALEEAEENKLISSSFEILPQLAEYYDIIGDHPKAYVYLSRYLRLKDSEIIHSQHQFSRRV